MLATLPKPRKTAIAVLMAFTIITAPQPDGNAWKHDPRRFTHVNRTA